MMVYRYCNIILFIISFVSIVDSCSLSPFDIRIDHHKVDTINDLIINTPRPKFSWKIPISNNASQRNINQIAYQIQLQSIKLTAKDTFYEWDSKQIFSSQSIDVPFGSDIDLFSSRYYRLRIRIWIRNCDEGSEWTKWIEFRTSIFNLNDYIRKNDNLIWIGSTKLHMNELRKEFNLSNISPLKSAIVYMTGIGYYQFYLNGKQVDPSRKLDPGWTTYEKRTLLVSYDVTSNITVRYTHLFSLKRIFV